MNNQSEINFKSTSDGWRGKLADNFTFANVELIAKGIAHYLKTDAQKNKVAIGYDTRFMSEEFAKFISTYLQNQGINVHKLSAPSPTPLLSFVANKNNFPLAINITASHNPPFYNGIKIRMNYGGTPTKDIIQRLESYFYLDLPRSATKGIIKSIDPIKEYISQIRKLVDFKYLKECESKILVDTMHGTTKNILSQIFENTKVQIDYVHDNFDPYFGGINPEPKFESTMELQEIVDSRGYAFGIAHDGDGDRITGTLPKTGYLSPHDVSTILVLYLAKYRGLTGKVLGSSTLGRRMERVCDHLNLKYETMPVGFKNATEGILNGEVLVAAEENGGIGFGFYLPERDATLAASLLIEAHSKLGLKKLLDEIKEIAGESGFCRYNFTPVVNRSLLFKEVVKTAKKFNYKSIFSISNLDGIKIIYINGDWLSIRYSGTEDILRIYCESGNREDATKIKDFAVKQLKILEGKIT